MGSADRKPMHVFGVISGQSNGIPTEMKVAYSNDMGVAHYRMEYHYQTYQFPYLPTEMRAYFTYQGKEILYQSYHPLEVRLANHLISAEEFDPMKMFHKEEWIATRYVTNDSLYVALPNGRMLKTETLDVPRVRFVSRDYYRARYAYLAMATLFVTFCVLAVRMQKSRTT